MGRKYWVCVVLFLSVLLSSSGVFARESVDSVINLGENVTEAVSICYKANNSVGEDVLEYTGEDGVVSFSNKTYATLDMTEKRKFMETALSLIQGSGMAPGSKNKFYNFVSDQDTTASSAIRYLRSDAQSDISTAAGYLRPFNGVVGTILGVLCIVIFVMLALSMVIDISYMVIPGMRVVITGGNDSGNSRPRFVSREAFAAVKESEESLNTSNYRGYMGSYLKKRVFVMLAIGVALGFLVSGQIYDLMTWFIDAFSWIFTWGA